VNTPDYTTTCGHCVLPIEGRSTRINDIAFHPSCLSIMNSEMTDEISAEYEARQKAEGITDYQLSADDADYQGWINR
jgi:hypothetical protein